MLLHQLLVVSPISHVTGCYSYVETKRTSNLCLLSTVVCNISTQFIYQHHFSINKDDCIVLHCSPSVMILPNLSTESIYKHIICILRVVPTLTHSGDNSVYVVRYTLRQAPNRNCTTTFIQIAKPLLIVFHQKYAITNSLVLNICAIKYE